MYWGVLVQGYFFVLLVRLALSLRPPFLRRGIYLLTLSACLSLNYSLLIPYLPEDIPRWASLHVFLAAFSCVLLMAALLAVMLHLKYFRLLGWWLIIVVCCGLLFWGYGMVTTALEVFFTLSSSVLTRSIWLRRRKELQS